MNFRITRTLLRNEPVNLNPDQHKACKLKHHRRERKMKEQRTPGLWYGVKHCNISVTEDEKKKRILEIYFRR